MGRNSYCDPEVSMALLSPNVVLLGGGCPRIWVWKDVYHLIRQQDLIEHYVDRMFTACLWFRPSPVFGSSEQRRSLDIASLPCPSLWT